jgi:hypothetical protein
VIEKSLATSRSLVSWIQSVFDLVTQKKSKSLDFDTDLYEVEPLTAMSRTGLLAARGTNFLAVFR